MGICCRNCALRGDRVVPVQAVDHVECWREPVQIGVAQVLTEAGQYAAAPVGGYLLMPADAGICGHHKPESAQVPLAERRKDLGRAWLEERRELFRETWSRYHREPIGPIVALPSAMSYLRPDEQGLYFGGPDDGFQPAEGEPERYRRFALDDPEPHELGHREGEGAAHDRDQGTVEGAPPCAPGGASPCAPDPGPEGFEVDLVLAPRTPDTDAPQGPCEAPDAPQGDPPAATAPDRRPEPRGPLAGRKGRRGR